MSHPDAFTDTYDEDDDPFFYGVDYDEESDPWLDGESWQEELLDENRSFEEWYAILPWKEKIQYNIESIWCDFWWRLFKKDTPGGL